MHIVELRLGAEGNDTTTVEVGNGATTRRISPRNAKKIQAFADNYQVQVDVVGSRVDPAKEITPGQSDWDYLINLFAGATPTKSLRRIEDSAGKFLPKGRARTDEFGNTRAGLDTERNMFVQPANPTSGFVPESSEKHGKASLCRSTVRRD